MSRGGQGGGYPLSFLGFQHVGGHYFKLLTNTLVKDFYSTSVVLPLSQLGVRSTTSTSLQRANRLPAAPRFRADDPVFLARGKPSWRRSMNATLPGSIFSTCQQELWGSVLFDSKPKLLCPKQEGPLRVACSIFNVKMEPVLAAPRQLLGRVRFVLRTSADRSWAGGSCSEGKIVLKVALVRMLIWPLRHKEAEQPEPTKSQQGDSFTPAPRRLFSVERHQVAAQHPTQPPPPNQSDVGRGGGELGGGVSSILTWYLTRRRILGTSRAMVVPQPNTLKEITDPHGGAITVCHWLGPYLGGGGRCSALRGAALCQDYALPRPTLQQSLW